MIALLVKDDRNDEATGKEARRYAVIGVALAGLIAVALLFGRALPAPGLFTAETAVVVTGYIVLFVAVAVVFLYLTAGRLLAKLNQRAAELEETAHRLESVSGRMAARQAERRGPEATGSGGRDERADAASGRRSPPAAVAAKPEEGVSERPRGDPVDAIEGIGPTYAKQLERAGIHTVQQMRDADIADVARRVDTDERSVGQWQAMAQLMDVEGIGPQYAELLVRSGITSLADLRSADPETVLARVKQTEADRETRIQGGDIGRGVVTRWIEAARKTTG